MDSYKGFAYVYDELMDNLDYDKWLNYILELLEENVPGATSIVELGCGTGTITKGLADNGYNVLGVDLSEDMLSIAMNTNTDEKIMYVRQDMTQLDLGGTYDAFVSVGDSVNYITDEDALLDVFKGVARHLADDGVFVFDLKTKHLYETIGDSVIADNRDDMAMIWENSFENDINEYAVTVFVEREDGLYERIEEVHKQRAYSVEQIESLLAKAGMEGQVYEAFTKNAPDDSSERFYFVARKK